MKKETLADAAHVETRRRYRRHLDPVKRVCDLLTAIAFLQVVTILILIFR